MSVFTKIWETVKGVIPRIGHASVIDIGRTVLFAVPAIIEDISEFVGMAPAEKIDTICQEIRSRTGIESGAVDIIRDLPADQEDRFFDAIAVLIEIIAKNRLRVAGYFVPGTPVADFSVASAYLEKMLSEKVNDPSPAPVPAKDKADKDELDLNLESFKIGPADLAMVQKIGAKNVPGVMEMDKLAFLAGVVWKNAKLLDRIAADLYSPNN